MAVITFAQGVGQALYMGLSTDTKPTVTPGGSFIETDTGLVFRMSGGVWTAAPGATGPQGPAGPEGPQGIQGIQGIPGVPGGGTTTRVMATVPFPAKRSATVNVVDATILVTSRIVVCLAGSADSAENDADSVELLGLSAYAKTGSMDVRFNFLTPHAGSFPINYSVAN